jgi:hypothetical protein
MGYPSSVPRVDVSRDLAGVAELLNDPIALIAVHDSLDIGPDVLVARRGVPASPAGPASSIR